jgi:succinate dehydrogenase/fumarate reductase flavoprotein subunit
MKNFDRRDFIKGTLAAGALAAGGVLVGCTSEPGGTQPPSDGSTGEGSGTPVAEKSSYTFETPPAPIAESDIVETIESDVVVVGGGAAGFVAANVAAERGAQVTLISKAAQPEAHGGDFFGANTKAMKAAGIPEFDLINILPKRFRDNSYNIDQDKWYLLMNKNPEAIDWLTDKMESNGYRTIFLDGYTDPDSGEVLVYGATHQWVKEGELLGTSGAGVLEVLATSAEGSGIRMDFSTTGTQLVRESSNGRVTAVVASDAGGAYRKYVARKAVILATGDFSADSEMMQKYCPEYEGLNAIGVSAGDGQKMGLWAGAAWQRTLPNAAMAETMSGNIATSNSLLAFSGLTINKLGKRYGNEFCGIGHAAHAQMRQPDRVAICIWDVDYAQLGGPWSESWTRGSNPAELPSEWEASVTAEPFSIFGSPLMTTVMADSLEELANELKMDPAVLAETVERYNSLCEKNVDEDFGKKARMMIPVKQPPFFAHFGTPWVLIVTGGLRANTKMQALDENDEPIPGLYLAGTLVGDMYNIYDFIFGGIHLGLNCTTFGYIAGEEAAQA